MSVPLQVLVVDDQVDQVDAILDELRQAGFTPASLCAATEQEFLSYLTEKLDLIIVDCGSVQVDGRAALRQVQERGLLIPCIVVAGSIGEEAAVEYIRQGAADFVRRDRLQRLGQAVELALQATKAQAEKRRQDAALRESEARYRAIAELGADYAYSLRIEPSGEPVLEWISKSFMQLTGFTLEEMNGRGDWSSLVHPDDMIILQPRMHSLMVGQAEVTEFRIVAKNGSVRWIRDYARPVWNQEHNRVIRIDGAGHDITVQKVADAEIQRINTELEEYLYERTAELHRQQTLLQTILDSMGEGVLYSKDYRIRYANRALAELTGYRIEDLLDQPSSILKSDQASEEDARLLTDRVAELGLTWRGETKLRRKDGTDFDAALTITLMTQPRGEITGAVMIIRDITAEKQLQEQKARFIANASHELRTPLTNIKTRLYLMRKQPERINEHSVALERAADQMASLVEDLLDISRFERGVISVEREDVILQNLITDVVEAQQPEAARKHITLMADIPSQPVSSCIDQNRIAQVITNLVVNAINYTPEGRHVSVQLRAEAAGCAVIKVQDTGIGIAPEHLTRVFEPFYRVNDNIGRGTGLGLSISKEIIALHGGTLTVDSELGKGSTFTVQLPIRDSQTPIGYANCG